MSQNNAQQIYPEVLRTTAAATIAAASGAYVGVGTPLLHPGRIYWLQNNTDVILTFSWDGINNHFKLPSGAFVLLDVTSNKTSTGGAFMVSEGTRTYVSGDPSTGTVDLASFFGSGSVY